MEIALTSSDLHLFPTDERDKRKDVGINFSFLPINPKSYLDDSQKLIRTGRSLKERSDLVMSAPKKRKHSDSDEAKPEKRQNKTITEPVDAALIRHRDTKTGSKVTRIIREKSLTTSRIRIHDTKTNPKVIITTKPGDKIENQNQSFKDLIAKAREKLQEKRQIDHRKASIARDRIAARLALDQLVATVDIDDHLKYHKELQQLGCEFIRDQVSCLNMFDLLSRSDYTDESNSVLVKNEMPRSIDEDSMSKRQMRSNN